VIFVLTFGSEAERDTFEALYERYRKLMFAKARDILRDPMLAEDAVSEAFLRVYRNMDKVEGVDSPRTAAFLVTIVRNVALTLYAKRKGEAAPEEDAALDAAAGADPHGLEELAASELTGEQVARAVGALDEQARTIFVLKYAYDVPHREIAAQCGITENNVTVKLHRIRRKLAEALAEEVS
jgi:RNA polymerase sigma-70 factor (ECF subfamily)